MRSVAASVFASLLTAMGVVTTAPAAEGLDPARPLWMRAPAISPDGTRIAFTYRGQIWTVPADGGQAEALTERQFRATSPVWAPDSSAIAFSAAVFNVGDVYIAPLDGTAMRRLTHHELADVPLAFTPDGKDILYSAARNGTMDVNYFDAIMGFNLGQLQSVPAAGGRSRIAMPLPAHQVSVSPDGKLIAYAFIRSEEVEQRKRQISDGTTDIWLFDRTTGKHRQLTSYRGNERSPVISADGKSVYFTAEMPKGWTGEPDAKPVSTNVWRQAIDGKSAPEQVTFHDTLPVRGLSLSNAGNLVYGFDGEIWSLAPGDKEPKKVAIRIPQGTLMDGQVPVSVNDQVTEMAVSPDGSEIAVIARGDVFVVQLANGRTRRITATRQAERSVSYSPGGRSLLYASDRQTDWDLFESRIVGTFIRSFVDAPEIEEKVLLDTESDVLQPVYSPDGDRVAYRDDRNALKVLDIATGQSIEVLPDDATYSYSEGDLVHAWSPDGAYLVTRTGVEVGNSEIEVIDSRSGERHNISLSGFGDDVPVFAADGRRVIWMSDRYATRKLDDQAATRDVVMTSLFKPTGIGASNNAANRNNPDWQGAPDRVQRLTAFSQATLFLHMSPDNQHLTLVSLLPAGNLTASEIDIWTGASRTVANLPPAPDAVFAASSDGQALFVYAQGQITRIVMATGEATPVAFDTTAPHDFQGEMSYLFDHQWRFVQSKFYDATMHGVDWNGMRGLYAKHLDHISHWEDFAELMAELQGELNASHMFSNFHPAESWWDQTASLGAYYDTTYEGVGVRIAGIMPDGPADFDGSLLQPGAIIETVNGVTIGPDADIYPLLNRQAGKPLRLGIIPPGGSSATEQVVAPVTQVEENALAYKRWVLQRRAMVETLSKGRLGYVHVPAMNNDAMQQVYSELLGRYGKTEAAVVDVRFNTGGFLHDQLVAFLTGSRHSGLVSRNGADYGTSPYDRWARPTALVQNAFSYSDGSIFPFYYKREKLGPIVGDRVPGTGTAVYTIGQIEPKLAFGVAQIGFRTLEGQFFENTEIVPDLAVPTNPNDIVDGRDRQLEETVRLLLAEIDKK